MAEPSYRPPRLHRRDNPIKAKTLQDLFKRYRRPGDLVFSLLFLAMCLFLAFNLADQTTWSKGTKLFAQPALWPYIAVTTMTFFATLHLVSGLMSPVMPGRWKEIGFWLRSFEFAGWFMAYVYIVPKLGYLPSTLLFSVSLTYRLGYRTPKQLMAAGLFAVTVVVLFKSLLKVKVPGGQLYELLPGALRSFMLTYF